MVMENEIPERVSPKRASEILGVHVQSIYDAIDRDSLTAVKPVGATTGWTIAREDLIAYRDRTQPNGEKRVGRPRKREAVQA